MVRRLGHIGLLMALLLMVGGAVNVTWGAKVTYHILTLPFTTLKDNGTALYTNIRVEAIRCTSDELTVGLPEYFKSPLASNFTYYAASNVKRNGTLESEGGSDDRKQIYQYIVTKYDVYDIVDPNEKLTVGDAIADGSHIYVTYTYDNTTSPINLNGTVEDGGINQGRDYNIKLGNRFLCFNRGRNNRLAAILATNVSEENLTSTDFSYVTTIGFSNTNNDHYFHFRFYYEGNDPYNITIRTSYNGDGTFWEADKALNKTVKKYYKWSSVFSKGESDGKQNLWMSSDDERQYTQTDANGAVTWNNKPGFYRGGNGGTSEMNPIFNSFAILSHSSGDGSYILMGSKINANGNNWQPNGNGQYFYLTGDIESGKNPKYQLKAPDRVEKTADYPIDTYHYKVTTPLTNTVITVDVNLSNYNKSARLDTHIPNDIKRKYASFTGTYSDAALTNAISTFEDAIANDNTIWLKYTSELPFETLPSDGCYDDARWYTIRMNGDQENQYVAYLDGTSGNMYTGRGSNAEDKLHQGENSPEAMVAFIGDPFELKILNRKASEDATDAAGVDPVAAHNRFIGCTGASTPMTLTTGSAPAASTWEIVYETTQMGTMILRQLGTATTTPKYIGWDYLDANKPMKYSATSSRIKVVELDKKNYVYHIVRSDGTIAVKATEAQDVGKRLKYKNIPEVIRSPLIDPSQYTATVAFYWTKADADAGTNAKRNASYDADIPNEGDNVHVYVRYTSSNSLSRNYHVRLNNQYLYNDGGNIKSQATAGGSEDTRFQWHLNLSDPYSMTINNVGSGLFLKKDGSTWANNQSLAWDAAVDNASLFIVKNSTVDGNYEVMAATGDDIDASTTCYYIGRPEVNTVKIYSSYPHGYAQIRFLLTATDATPVDYHLIDKSNTELLVVRSMRQDLFFPGDYRSPLVETYHYYKESTLQTEINGLASAVEVEGVLQVYVTYTTSSRVNLQKGVLYLLKFESGDSFYQENGADGFTSTTVRAVYPYCNGDCNFFVYGQDEYDLQQQGAASTRTRWAWYLESANNDPYHIKICSRQTETFNSAENRGYFCTYVESWGASGQKHVITGLVWPGITGDQGTEYMVLGSEGQYQLVTTETIPIDLNGDDDTNDDGENERQTVKSFEQYWKTFDTIRKKVFGDPASTISPEQPSIVPATPKYAVTEAAGETDNRTYLVNQKGFHNYPHWAYAKRWNGYNISGAKSKGWEDIEHWYQTVNMGEGYFDLVPITIDPALILLDQHGWEIMRKPLPSSPDDPDKDAKYEAIRPYDSPMVKEYIFWSSAKKRTGFHQYYLMDKRVGGDFTSTSLTDLPPYGSANVFDAKGNLNDQYVTYIVKDEYAHSYSPSSKAGAPFIIQQGDKFVYNNASSIGKEDVPATGGMPQYIIDNIGTIYQTSPEAPALGTKALWFVKPNADIDTEMGYLDGNHSWGTGTPNAYEDNNYKNNIVACIIEGSSSDATIKKYGRFSFSNGFDPYNIQISSVAETSKFFVTNAEGGKLDNGSIVATSYDGDPAVSLETAATGVTVRWYDSKDLPITNATFMAVMDEEGNMQLMPRFDHALRVRDFTKIETPVEQVGDEDKLKEMQTQLFRPMVYNYRIIDNEGKESLRYQTAGEFIPQIPDHIKSPFAKDFKYYKSATETSGTYSNLTDEITASLAGAGLTSTNAIGNVVYVRYLYDEDADQNHILKGKWFTMQLNALDAKYDNGIKQGTKPSTVDSNEKSWQWKFLETPQSNPDPYAVSLYNRNHKDVRQPSDIEADLRFALLSHTSGSYALAKAGRGDYTYQFLNGTSMSTTTAASLATESGFKGTSCSYSGTGSQVKLIDDVVHTYIYKVYTNGTNGSNAVGYGVLAISGSQSQAEASINEFVPTIPDVIKTPLLNHEDFLYYEAEADMGNSAKELQNLYGLYDDELYVRYKAYNPKTTSFQVPNDKAIVGGHAARGTSSHDTPLGLSGNLLYNIVWYNDETMKSNGSSIDKTSNLGTTLKPESAYEWKLEGDDPYAIKVKSMSDKYVYNSSSNSCTLDDANATTFMLLNKDGHDYGILQVTGDANSRKWSGYGNSLTANAATDPTHYVIYALATKKVIYHLRIATTNETITIPYRNKDGNGNATPSTYTNETKDFKGSTQRDLTSNTGAAGAVAGDKYQLGSTISLFSPAVKTTYCYDAGCISLGDILKVPDVFYRPNVNYHFIVEGVYDNVDCTSPNTDLNDKYKGLEVETMGDDIRLLGKTVLVNILYTFDQSLETNTGADFVRDVANDKRWYTFETISGGQEWLAQFTNALGGFEVKEGRGSHYTNDYLWSPLGDPYGFKMYNRYIFKNSGETNSGETNRVMTTTAYAERQAVSIGDNSGTYDAKSIYELLTTNTDGYFRVHPVDNQTGTQYYLRTVADGGGVYVKLSTVASEWRFGLSEDLVKPYYDRAGYVGGLTDDGKELYKAAANLMEKQAVVYDDANLVQFTPGYYRLHSPDDIVGIMEERYASGYTHKLELDYDGTSADANSDGNYSYDPIPMHFYEKKGSSTTFALLKSKDGQRIGEGFTVSDATRGDIPIPAVEYDPASIFYITGEYDDAIMSTQGLYVRGEKTKAQNESDGERAKALMTATSGDAMHFWVMDIGGTVMLIHDQNAPATRKYLSYDQTDASRIYDLKITHNSHTDHAKWCLQPVNDLGLYITTHSGGDETKYGTSYNYASFYAPFDILLPEAEAEPVGDNDMARIYQAFILDDVNSPWDGSSSEFDLHPKGIGRYNTGTYAGNDRFVPAGTPVLLAMWDQSGYVKATLPNKTPSTSLTTSISYTYGGADPVACNNILTGQYLEQKLTDVAATERIFTFGMPIEASTISLDPATGVVSATLATQANAGLGFYLNATPNKEEGLSKDEWIRNNRYVLNNKVYYKASGFPASAPGQTRDIQYVPVLFDEGEEEEQPEETQPQPTRVGDGCVYDILGRKVASAEEVKAGTWYRHLSPGVYIVNGQKVFVGVGRM